MNHKVIFIGGLHRSGTSALYKLLGSDPRVSIFRDTGVIEDEGQFLQSVYATDEKTGGVGQFGLVPKAHFTEYSPLLNKARKKLASEWSSYWDMSKPVLAEKTPANILKSRFLQAVFPNSSFIFIMRHPVASAMATTKWTGAYMTTLINNWLRCHEILMEDLPKIRSALVLKYEDFTIDPESYSNQFEQILGFSPNFDWKIIKPGLNDKYYRRYKIGDYHLKGPKWKGYLKRWKNLYEIGVIEKKFESRLNEFGYSFTDVY